jgi:sugar phosphate isomerase/epimerase
MNHSAASKGPIYLPGLISLCMLFLCSAAVLTSAALADGPPPEGKPEPAASAAGENHLIRDSNAPALMPNPFYVMDTAFAPPFRHPKLTMGGSFEMIKELGFAGVGWTEKAPSEVKSDVEELEKRGMRMYAIYFRGNITSDGELTVSERMPAIMDVLKGHDTLLWLHISGKGPDFETLTVQSPAVVKLRGLAEAAKGRGLKIALYPHLGEWIEKFGNALRLAELVDHPNLGVSFNLCHCLATGDEANIPALLTRARPVLLTATICGADSGVRAPEKEIWKKLIQPLGQGTFDVRIVLNKLREIGFTGPIGFQGYGIAGEPRGILEPTIAAWRELSGQVR